MNDDTEHMTMHDVSGKDLTLISELLVGFVASWTIDDFFVSSPLPIFVA